jgi:hypothetical protein
MATMVNGAVDRAIAGVESSHGKGDHNDAGDPQSWAQPYHDIQPNLGH